MIFSSPFSTGKILLKHSKILKATTNSELVRRYSGTFFGVVWIPLYPILFLSVYLFVYLVVFKTRWPAYSELDYVLYVFSGLVPFIAFMETFQSGAQSIKQNMHLIKNILLPVELIPARTVGISLVALLVGLLLVTLLATINGSIGLSIFLLPVGIIIHALFLLGLAYMMAPVGLLVPDINHMTGLLSLLLVFISPIGFRPDMVPESGQFIIWLNPLFYLVSPFRMAFGFGEDAGVNWIVVGIGGVIAIFTFAFGTLFFRRFKSFLVDYE